jgi:hypothetical protein
MEEDRVKKLAGVLFAIVGLSYLFSGVTTPDLWHVVLGILHGAVGSAVFVSGYFSTDW